MHFDDAELSKELVIRPVDDRGRSIWHWSGGFQLRDRCCHLTSHIHHDCVLVAAGMHQIAAACCFRSMRQTAHLQLAARHNDRHRGIETWHDAGMNTLVCVCA